MLGSRAFTAGPNHSVVGEELQRSKANAHQPYQIHAMLKSTKRGVVTTKHPAHRGQGGGSECPESSLLVLVLFILKRIIDRRRRQKTTAVGNVSAPQKSHTDSALQKDIASADVQSLCDAFLLLSQIGFESRPSVP